MKNLISQTKERKVRDLQAGKEQESPLKIQHRQGDKMPTKSRGLW